MFKALADPTRRAILDELQERSGQTLFELCTRLLSRHGLGSSRQAVSQHLDVLEDAGLVRTRREGRYKFHDLDTSPLSTITHRWRVDPKRGHIMRINLASVLIDVDGATGAAASDVVCGEAHGSGCHGSLGVAAKRAEVDLAVSGLKPDSGPCRFGR